MKKIIITLIAMFLMLSAALPCFAEPPAAGVLPSIKMEQQKKEYRTPQGQVCIVTDYTRLVEWSYRMTDEAKEDYKDAVELKMHRPEDYMYFLLEERIWQRYLDRNILSLYVEYYQSRGGAHPNTDIFTYNLDPVTGNFITMDDALAPGKRNEFRDKYVKSALEKVKKERQLFYYDNYKAVVDNLFQRDYAGEPPLKWTWGTEGITMIFPPDTLGPAVMGPVEAFIPFKGNEKLFNEKYLK